jgi:hypothetical protein
MRIWQRLQQNAFKHAKYNRIGAHASRQRDQRYGGKHGRADQPPQHLPELRL